MILVKLATRSRPEKAIKTIQAFALMATDDIRFIVSIDEDDPTMNTTEMRVALAAAGLGHDVKICVGHSENKIHACNRDLEGETFDILVLAADDMAPKIMGWNDVITQEMQSRFPDGDGALWFHDGHTKAICTLPVMSYSCYNRFGYIYHPSYISLWADNEFTEVLQSQNKLPFIDRCIIEHQHPAHMHTAPDALLKHTESFYGQDLATYQCRKAAGFNGKSSDDILFTIGICTIPSRQRSLRLLIEELGRQLAAHPQHERVEILVEHDDMTRSTGSKRNAIIDRAKGRYIAFIDDDDMVTEHYVGDILNAMISNPDCDCIKLTGVTTVNGGNPKQFIHSVEYDWYFEKDNIYYRCPNHLSPVRVDAARAAMFPDISYAEDDEYARRLKATGMLKTEAKTEHTLYKYIYVTKQSTSTKAARSKRR